MRRRGGASRVGATSGRGATSGGAAIAAGAAAALLAALAGCDGGTATAVAEAPAAPREDVVVRGDLQPRLLLTGEIEAVESIELRVPRTNQWQLSIRHLVEDGTLVEEGDLLVEFDNSAFAGQLEEKRLRLTQARLELDTAEATAAMETGNKEAEVARRRAQLEKAELMAGVPAHLQPMRDYQERQLERDRARMELERAEKDLATYRKTSALDLQVKRIEIEKIRREVEIAEEGIAALSLKAPRAGIAIVRDHPWEGRELVAGDTVQPGWEVVELPEMSAMRVLAYLSDVDDGAVTPGARVLCRLDAYPDAPFEGTVEEITAVAHEVAQQSLRRAFHVRVALERTDPERMRPGMSVQVEVPGPRVSGALLAPRAGLDLSGEVPVAILAGGERKEVTLGACDAHRCVVEEGLTEGQRLEAAR